MHADGWTIVVTGASGLGDDGGGSDQGGGGDGASLAAEAQGMDTPAAADLPSAEQPSAVPSAAPPLPCALEQPAAGWPSPGPLLLEVPDTGTDSGEFQSIGEAGDFILLVLGLCGTIKASLLRVDLARPNRISDVRCGRVSIATVTKF